VIYGGGRSRIEARGVHEVAMIFSTPYQCRSVRGVKAPNQAKPRVIDAREMTTQLNRPAAVISAPCRPRVRRLQAP
jgi:hypothetical protein